MYLKTLTRVDAFGKIAVPKRMRKELGLKEGNLVEMETRKAGRSLYVTIKQYAPYPRQKAQGIKRTFKSQSMRSLS